MDIWHAMGISQETGLLAAAGCVLAAFLLAATLVVRRGREEPRGALRLKD